GLDQTRGWFYTLIVLGTALFGTHPFKNVIVNGIVMAEDGKKMSKSLRNYSPPDDLMETYGADALRLYLINSGLVKAEEQRFADSGVKDMVRRALLPWLNAYKFLNTYAQIDNWQPDASRPDSTNIMDQWILSRLESLKDNIATEMENYRLYNVVPALFDFIEDLTNWYIRLNRSRFWAEGEVPDKFSAYQTLYDTLYELSLSMAPFAPFLSETIYQSLRKLANSDLPPSVHLCLYPESNNNRIKPLLEQAVTRMQHIILLGRQKRNQEKVKTKYPVGKLTVVHRDPELLEEIGRLEGYLSDELNTKTIEYSTEESQYIHLYAKPNSPVLGKRLGKDFKKFKQLIEGLDSITIEQFQNSGSLDVDGESFQQNDILIFREAREGTNAVSDRFISIDMDCTLNEDLVREGLAREVINRIQKSRKDSGFNVSDRIRLSINSGDRLVKAIKAHEDYIKRETLTLDLQYVDEPGEMVFDIDGEAVSLSMVVSE
ncbi:MAG: class I tRNA ligase family protein, partial [Gammaproteobacteria bacterium]|nr:class I tRNA ligase family protein [Gammaproteobacteria bacterium]